MPFNAEQQRAIDAYLYINQVDEGNEPTMALVVTKRQLKLILEAVDYYRETKCPMKELSDECAALAWVEDVYSGAIKRVCTGNCEAWLDSLITKQIPRSFPPRANQA